MSESVHLCGVDSDHEGMATDWECDECIRIGTLIDEARKSNYKIGKEHGWQEEQNRALIYIEQARKTARHFAQNMQDLHSDIRARIEKKQ